MTEIAGDHAAALRARFMLLVTCVLAFVLLLWCAFAAPVFSGAIGWEGSANGTVTYLVPGMPGARAGLRIGDSILRKGTISERLARRLWIAGRPQPLYVQRGGHQFIIRVVPVALHFGPPEWLALAQSFWMSAFATIVAFRGTSRVARLLSWLLVTEAIAALFYSTNAGGFMSPWPWMNEAALMISYPLTALANALLATVASNFGCPLSRLRRGLELGTYALASVSAIMGFGAELTALLPWTDRFNSLSAALFDLIPRAFDATMLLAIVCACAALFAARGQERQRASWLLFPLITLYIISFASDELTYFVGGNWSSSRAILNVVTSLASFIVPVVLAYGVLKRRLLDIDFFINRAAVFAAVSFVVIGLFVLAEWLLNKAFAETGLTNSAAVDVGLALALGVSLRFIHRHVDRVVDHVLFRSRHEHEQSLRMFAHEAAYITDYDTLLDATIREVSKNAEANGVSVLVRSNGNYVTVRATNGSSVCVTENDRAVLKMRTWHTAVNLDEVDSALDGASAYPLTSHGDLVGILVCGSKRDGQGYAPDEAEALSMLAQAVANALGSLRAPQDSNLGIADLEARIEEMRDSLQTIINEQRRIRNELRSLSGSE